ncbi:RNA polymerase sigma factor [Brumimicrobium aurantiacum]|uniref:RNA polymerase sigma factor n=1 Tax=Brumimicrobium aurantiacum TaxID=1737063 RepID=A0A3E1EYH2_9FLAO|nr:RNA polymerase sigma factor [Brumimicrobium aurantiacum]RFC54594.1 RNA polymerase sigma factor [Brumimicrobium aurantiacum]
MSETEIIQNVTQLKNGSHEALENIYDNFSPALYGLCLKIVKDEALAQDILQEAFVKIWSKANKYDENKGSFYTWMLNITRNLAIDNYRKITRHEIHSIQTSENSVYSLKDDKMDIPIHQIGLKDLINGLPDEQVEMIEYLYFKGYTQQETSDELNIPLGTVKTRSRTAIASLREIFKLFVLWI